MTPAAGALEHRGLLHDSSDGVAAAALPTVRAALAAGDAVVLLVDRRTAHEIRAALEPDGNDLVVAAPTEAFRPDPTGFLHLLRTWVVPGRRTLVLGQYSALDVDPDDHAFVEDAIDLVLADLPLTVLCTCARDADPGADRLRRHHRLLQDGDAVVANPDHQPCPDRSPVRSALWGPAVLRADFRDLADLRDLRVRVAAVTADAGLAGETADAAVLAVHEAAVMACAMRGDTAADCTVEIRTVDRTMFTEVTAPGVSVPAPPDDDPLAVLRLLSRTASVEGADSEQRIRVLSTG